MDKKAELREARELFQDLADELGNGHLPLVLGFSGRANDTFPKLAGSSNLRTQPVEQQMRLYKGYPEDELVPIDEPMGIVALHAWLSWALGQPSYKKCLVFAAEGSAEEDGANA